MDSFTLTRTLTGGACSGLKRSQGQSRAGLLCWTPRAASSITHGRTCCPTERACCLRTRRSDRKSTRLNSSHQIISYAVFCLKKKSKTNSGRVITEYLELQEIN